MGLIVPLIRLCYVAYNVYETFKTLKLPAGSSRNGGKPTVRAMSQRKRAMKGCLAIWLVWCCYVAYERTVDGIVGMFIPFYSEIKAIIILFFLLTRARGAEPVYLHILRPVVKPYTATLDTMLEFITQVGDLIFLLCAVPIHMVASAYNAVWRRLFSRTPAATEETKAPEIPVEEKQQGVSEHGETRTRKRALHNAHLKAAAEPSSPEVSIYATPRAAPEVWQPPPAAFEDSPPRHLVGLPTPPAEDRQSKPKYVDEWRQYEAFPSAWPASPQSNISGLPSESLPSFDEVLAKATKAPQQGFRRSLQSSRESLNPDSDGHLSDDREEQTGVYTDEEMEIDEDYEDEDDFNVTLRTPYPLSRIMNVSGMTASMEEDSYDESTGISTTDYDSPLRTRTNSDASAPPFDDSPTTAKKRRLPSPGRPTQGTRTTMRDRAGTQDTIRAKAAPVRASVRAPLVTRKQSSRSESSATEAQASEDADDTSVVKKRLVEAKPKAQRPGAVRPVTTKVGENKVPPRKIPTTTVPRGPMRPTTNGGARPAPKLATASSKDSTKRRVADKVTEESVTGIVDSATA